MCFCYQKSHFSLTRLKREPFAIHLIAGKDTRVCYRYRCRPAGKIVVDCGSDSPNRSLLIRFFSRAVRRAPDRNRIINDEKVFETATLITNANVYKKKRSKAVLRAKLYIRELCTRAADAGRKSIRSPPAAVTARGGCFGLRIMAPVGCTQVVPLKMQYNFLRVNSYVFSNSLFTRAVRSNRNALHVGVKKYDAYGNNGVSTLV